MADDGAAFRAAFRAHQQALAQHARLLVQSGNAVRVSTAVEYHGPVLKLFAPAQRNALLRDAGQYASGHWIGTYLPLRFNNAYARSLRYFVSAKYERKKALALGVIEPIKTRLSFFRWDKSGGTWVGNHDWAGLQRLYYEGVKSRMYRASREGWKRFLEDQKREWRRLQKQAEDRAVDQAKTTGALRPLVFSGRLERLALSGARPITRAAAGRFASVVRIPTPADPETGFNYGSHPKVNLVLQALPDHEVQQWCRRFLQRIDGNIATASPANLTRGQRQRGATIALPKSNQRFLLRNPVRSTRAAPVRRLHSA